MAINWGTAAEQGRQAAAAAATCCSLSLLSSHLHGESSYSRRVAGGSRDGVEATRVTPAASPPSLVPGKPNNNNNKKNKQTKEGVRVCRTHKLCGVAAIAQPPAPIEAPAHSIVVGVQQSESTCCSCHCTITTRLLLHCYNNRLQYWRQQKKKLDPGRSSI